MFISSESLVYKDTLVITDSLSFNKKYFESFFRESLYDVHYVHKNTLSNLDKNKYSKIYYIGTEALESNNKPLVFKKDSVEILLPYLPSDKNLLKILLQEDSISSYLTLEDFNCLMEKDISGVISFFIKEQGDKIFFDIYIQQENKNHSGLISLDNLKKLINKLEKNILIVFSSTALRRYLFFKGITLKSKTFDIKLMHYILTNDVLQFNITGDFSNTLYSMYTSYLSVIKDNNQEYFMKYLFMFKDILGFLETRGILMESNENSSFFSTNKKYLINDKFYPTYNNLTFSGRVYAHSPSITNMPRNEKHLLKPHNKNNILYSIDFNQLELRVLFSLLNSEVFIDSCNEGIDFHSKTASIILNKDINNITPEDRQKGKQYNFLILYGEYSDIKMSKYFNSLTEERKKLLNKFKIASKIITPFNRILFQTPLYDDKQLFNFYIQSTASDLVFTFLIELLQQVSVDKQSVVVYNITHDEIVFEIKKEDSIYLNNTILATLSVIENRNKDWLKTKLVVTFNSKSEE
jgi:DNA polymerase I-like protein with 3'-5' exonuclease and polymerase domains